MLKYSAKIVSLFLFGYLISISQLMADRAIINQKNTDIRVFIEMVGRLTGKTFVISPRVRKNKITVISQHEMNEDEIFSLFLSVLKLHRLSAVQTDGIYKIEQLQAAKQDSVEVYTEGKKYSGDQLVTRVIKVDNIEVSLLIPVLRSLIPQQSDMAQYLPTNVIVIHDTVANLERIVKIIKKIDLESNEEIEIINLEHASATEVVRILENLEKKNGRGRRSAQKPKYVADERTNSILLSANNKAALRLKVLIHQLDSEQKNSGNIRVRYLKNANAENLVKVLEGIGESIQSKQSIKKRGSKKTYSIKADKDTNSLVITAPPDIMKSFNTVIDQLDIRRQQVHVEAIIVEVSEDLNKKLGVQWGVAGVGMVNFSKTGAPITSVAAGYMATKGQKGSTTTNENKTAGTIETITSPSNGDGGKALMSAIQGVSGALLGFSDGKSWAALLNMIQGDVDSNVLSTPSVTTMDNKEALISVGEEISIATGSQLGSGNANPFKTFERKDIGIKLKITPQINEDNSVRLKIEQEVSGVAGDINTQARVNKRLIKTEITVRSGKTIVLGGLISETVEETESKVPLLGDIPFIGRLFRSSGTTKAKRNLMIFIRPIVMNNDADLDRLSRKKYKHMRKLQLNKKAKGISLLPFEDPAVLPEWDNTSLSLPPKYDDSKKERALPIRSKIKTSSRLNQERKERYKRKENEINEDEDEEDDIEEDIDDESGAPKRNNNTLNENDEIESDNFRVLPPQFKTES
jgi:general secretion pathway protein D